jgi:hypothetical protein
MGQTSVVVIRRLALERPSSVATAGRGRDSILETICAANLRSRRCLSQQGRRGPRDGEIGPLALGLHAEMLACLLECRLHGPAVDEPSQKGGRCRIDAAPSRSSISGQMGVTSVTPRSRPSSFGLRSMSRHLWSPCRRRKGGDIDHPDRLRGVERSGWHRPRRQPGASGREHHRLHIHRLSTWRFNPRAKALVSEVGRAGVD